MSNNLYLGLTITGMISGLAGGTIGAGSEILIVPLLSFFGIFSLKKRIGTSLFMLLPPIGVGATMRFWQAGHVAVWEALYMSMVFTIAASVSAEYSLGLDTDLLRKIFAIFTIVAGFYIYFNKEN